ncbi:response regulator transcription factor [Mariluticola halotolerans]|uniref:response regulator transcription factor n=1 Tax=Mariluticola halotolerans TaxID=2909283 RepID=UPI0026E21B82|nr:winged helix-turn-helix domain-containing protein [Mariluticola halotolerans]UJQ94509.1 winged helix-turn-helix domain-containing protein [Mariluticola halotolerans]
MEQRIQRVGVLDAGSDANFDLQHWLLQRGYLADMIQDPLLIKNYCCELKPAALLIDMSLIGQSGPKMVKELRDSGYTAPIIATLNGRDDALQVQTLQMGADDFLQHPMTTIQLLERLGLILRQSARETRAVPSQMDELSDVLTSTESRIVKALQESMPDPMRREQIMWAIKRKQIAPDDRSIDVYVSNIRRKLRMVHAGLAITTVRGVGFALTYNHEQNG